MNLIDLKKNPELIPVIEWWEKDGKQTVICVLVAVAAVAGWYGWKHHRASERAAASAAIAEANAPADLEDAVAKFSGTAAEPALEIKLAKSYYDDGRYDEALARYEEMSGKVPPEFADIPVVGKAMCLEALKKFPEALEAFDGFADQLPQPVRSGKRKADHRHAARSDQFTEACHKQPDSVPAVPFGVENTLGRTGGARGGVGEHPLNLRLRPEQQAGCMLCQILFRSKGEIFELREAVQPFRQIPVKAGPLSLHRQNAVQLFQLNRFDLFSVQGLQALLLHDEAVDPTPSHAAYTPQVRAVLSLPESPYIFQNSPP